MMFAPPIGIERLEPLADQPGGRRRTGFEAERAAAASAVTAVQPSRREGNTTARSSKGS